MIKIVKWSLLLLWSGVLLAEDKAPLPNWIDHSRETSDRQGPSVQNLNAPKEYQLPAEYSPVKAVVLGFKAFSPMLKDIAAIVANEGNAEVWTVGGPSYIDSVPNEKHKKISCPLNTVWMRDYGPFGVLSKEGMSGVVDSTYRHYSYRRYDDQFPTCMANSLELLPFGMDLILDGGNLMVDSKGNLFMTKRTYKWNRGKSKQEVDRLLKAYFGVHTIHALEYAGYPNYPADGTGHIDMYVKLLDDETVLITETDDEPFKTAAEKAVTYFKRIKTPTGNNYRIVRINGWEEYGTWYTYTNSLIVNNSVIIPAYGEWPDENQLAIEIYREAMPGISVHEVVSDQSIQLGGSIHCVTQQIPDF